MIVIDIPNEQAHPWILKKHYARRLPSISYAFGLYNENILVGIVTYGTPASSTLREGICGEQHAEKVLELNRLIVENAPKNAASFLIAHSIKLLPKPSIIVSYSDPEHGHVGYVYQACNFIYTGLSAKRTDWKIRGLEHLHGQTIADKSRGMKNRADYMRETYGEAFYLKERSQKHRYVYFHGCDSSTKSCLQYPIMKYPKGDTTRYDTGNDIPTQMPMFSLSM